MRLFRSSTAMSRTLAGALRWASDASGAASGVQRRSRLVRFSPVSVDWSLKSQIISERNYCSLENLSRDGAAAGRGILREVLKRNLSSSGAVGLLAIRRQDHFQPAAELTVGLQLGREVLVPASLVQNLLQGVHVPGF